MFGKIQITGKIEVMTGIHIGTSDGFALTLCLKLVM